jgi:hypothetical protein
MPKEWFLIVSGCNSSADCRIHLSTRTGENQPSVTELSVEEAYQPTGRPTREHLFKEEENRCR